jgi:hypothetical protein
LKGIFVNLKQWHHFLSVFQSTVFIDKELEDFISNIAIKPFSDFCIILKRLNVALLS